MFWSFYSIDEHLTVCPHSLVQTSFDIHYSVPSSYLPLQTTGKTIFMCSKERQSNPITGLDRPWGFQEFEAPRFQDNRHVKVIRLSTVRTGRLYQQEIFLVLISVRGWVNPMAISAAGRIMSMKNSNDTIGNRTRELLACSAVPQPTAPPAACPIYV